jgi:hypothetical protein
LNELNLSNISRGENEKEKEKDATKSKSKSRMSRNTNKSSYSHTGPLGLKSHKKLLDKSQTLKSYNQLLRESSRSHIAPPPGSSRFMEGSKDQDRSVFFTQNLTDSKNGKSKTLNSSLDLSRVNAQFRQTECFKDVIIKHANYQEMKKKYLTKKQKLAKKMASIYQTRNHILKTTSFDLMNHTSPIDDSTPLIIQKTQSNFDQR